MVEIRDWQESDLVLLEGLLGTPEMTKYVGGPESIEQIKSRHERYLRLVKANFSKARSFAICLSSSREPVGWVGYWEMTWKEELTYEIGWSVLSEFQGRGIATQATTLALKRTCEERLHSTIVAFPSIHNKASNALCHKLGFKLIEECDVEYPPTVWMRASHWRLQLALDKDFTS